MKKIVAILLSFVLVFSLISISASANPLTTENAPSNEALKVIKDETVYATLYADGSISAVNVVNRIDTPQSGIYTDLGVYETIANLSGTETPVLTNGKISWQLPARNEGFYYQGTLAHAELPFTFDISYKLDGKKINAEDLVGKSGRVSLTFNITSNDQAKAYYRENYLCQLQLPLSLDDNTIVSAKGASTIISGRTVTLAYMVLPGGYSENTLTFDTEKFQQDALTITCSCFDNANFLDIGANTEGLTQMSIGADALLTGTGKLKTGLIDLHNGLTGLSSGATQLQVAMSQLSQQGTVLDTNYTALSSGVSQLLQSFVPLLDSLPAQDRQAYLIQIESMNAQLSQYGQGLSSYTSGVSQSAQGSAVVAGGLSQVTANTESLPSEIQKLMDGQKQLKSGIDQITGLLKTFDTGNDKKVKPVSFVSDELFVRSVQFIIKTQDLKISEEKAVVLPAAENSSFWERFLKLFIH